MIKKISKVMWALVLGFVLFAFIVSMSTGNDLTALWSGSLVAYAFFAQIVLWIIGYFSKDKTTEEND